MLVHVKQLVNLLLHLALVATWLLLVLVLLLILAVMALINATALERVSELGLILRMVMLLLAGKIAATVRV